LKRNREKTMKRLDLIRKGAYVIRALSLEDQMRLCKRAKNGDKFDELLLTSLAKITHGKEFVKGYEARLLLEDLVLILTYSHELGDWIIDRIEDTDPELAETFKRNMFIFEDVILLAPKVIKKIMTKADKETIAVAMINADTKVKKYLMSFMPEKWKNKFSLKLLEIDTSTKATEAAQFEIVQIVRQMEESGTIRVERPSDPAEAIKIHLAERNVG
jgi:flagellar motor switch protein FliG